MEARPVTSSFGITPFPNRIINQGKKRMMNEIRFTEIER